MGATSVHPLLTHQRVTLCAALVSSLSFGSTRRVLSRHMSNAVDFGACDEGSPYDGRLGLRVVSVFVILVTSAIGTLLPIVSRQFRALRMPELLFAAIRYFGTGVILSTAFIHLLAEAWLALSSACLTGTWTEYPWPAALAMSSVFVLFVIELVAHRAGQAYLRKRGIVVPDVDRRRSRCDDTPAHSSSARHVGTATDAPIGHTEAAAVLSLDGERRLVSRNHGEALTAPEGKRDDGEQEALAKKLEEKTAAAAADEPTNPMDGAAAQIIGVAILEFGIIFHSVIIGLTLAVTADFVPIFIVIIFHQMFEGLGVGARLALLPLPDSWRWVPYAGAAAYSAVTPLGIAIGLGVRETYNPASATSLIVTGVFDSVSAGLLLWSSLVELLAHEFIFDRHMVHEASNLQVAYALACIALGALLMAILGKWA